MSPVTAKRKAAIVRAVKKRRRKVREMAVAYKGGKCQRCGYDRCLESLEFHHVEKDSKSFGEGIHKVVEGDQAGT